MKPRIRLSIAVAAIAMISPALALAQRLPEPANPAPGCSVTPRQLAANKRVAMMFFVTRGAARVALASPSYEQHNPVFKKRAEAAHETDYQEFRRFFLNTHPRAPQSGPHPPRGNPFEIVVAECDLVTIVHKVYLQDPTAPPGTFYASYRFDTFRVTNGKLTEHWDGALIRPAKAATTRR